MTTVFLDTNIFMNERFLKSADAQAFLKACKLLNISVAIPDVVVDEVKGNFPRTLSDRLASHMKTYKELAKIIDVDEPDVSIEGKTDEYNDWLDSFLKEDGIGIIPYPNITPKELVLKSYENVKPFKSTGEGHKDFMIWESIKSHIKGNVTAEPYYFLVNNPTDFCVEKLNKTDNEKSKDKEWILHPELATQFEDQAQVPTVFVTIGKFFDAIILPKLEGITIDQVPHLTIDEIDDMTTEILEKELSGYTAYGFLGVPFSNEVYANVVGETAIEDRELRKIDDGIVIVVTGTVLIEVEGYMDKHAYYSEEFEDSEIYVIDGDWNDHVMAVSSTVDTPFELKLFYSPETETVTGHSLTLPDEIHDEYPYK
jgi:hypothetical protein